MDNRLYIGVIVFLSIVIIYLFVKNRKKNNALVDYVNKTQEINRMLERERWESTSNQAKLNQTLQEHLDENAAMKEQLDEISFVLQNDVRSQYVSPLQGALHNLGMAFPDAQCVQKLEDAINDADILIKTHKAVCSSDETPILPGVEALVLSCFDSMADQVITEASASASYEKCEQDIYLAYYITNLRSEKTVHATVARRYLENKFEILRWTLTVQEYRRILREEDKNRREAEREDMRALREIKRREQDAIKEQKIYEQALQKARLEIQGSLSPEERRKLETRIQELEAQIVAKGDEIRALTAAQQGRSGTVYVISNVGSFGEDVYKIGMTRRLDPQERINELNEASTPFPFEVHAFIKSSDAPKLEHDLHKQFEKQKVNLVAHSNAREFYRVKIESIRDLVTHMGYTVSWKMEAEANQFVQSEKIRQGMLENSTSETSFGMQPHIMIHDTPESCAHTIASIEDLILDLESQKIAYLDKRGAGGCLWIESTSESDKYLQSIVSIGFRVTKARKTRHFNGNPGWFAR